MYIILFTEWRAVLTTIHHVIKRMIHIVTFASRIIVLMLRRRVTVMTVSNLCVQNVIRFIKGLTLTEDRKYSNKKCKKNNNIAKSDYDFKLHLRKYKISKSLFMGQIKLMSKGVLSLLF